MIRRATLAALWGGLLPAVARAAEGEGNLFAGDIGNAVWTLVIFIALILVLGKFAWGPLLGTLQQREKFIRDSLEQARQDREAAEARLKEYGEKLDAARLEATSIVEEGRRDGDELKRRLEQQARDEAESMIQRARREIDIAKQTAIKELYTTSAALATDIAGRIIRKELDAAEHERLISESIDEMEGLESN